MRFRIKRKLLAVVVRAADYGAEYGQPEWW
jgi:hypothetical protein